ncbi:putative lipoprotein [Bifidobacterium cuniculi]|uniref:Putative lipoprotein n=1 Tax=Bifidobacterium cuniculi TaxID=1688 RepID=A0A087AC38_9BIFI|nr:hypothetical protein [Bifidobacterium cuniculi]KFI56338.1 putative lipoprotein [Bifidobacterium cuniculi]
MTNATTTLLPVFDAPATERVWLVAAHGGAGCTTIYTEGAMAGDPMWADAGRALPASVEAARPSLVVLCAMGTGRGLESLRALLADWDAGAFGTCVLLGAAVTAPMARTPMALRRGTALVGAGAPRLWRLPYIEGARGRRLPSTVAGRVRARTRTGARRGRGRHGARVVRGPAEAARGWDLDDAAARPAAGRRGGGAIGGT